MNPGQFFNGEFCADEQATTKKAWTVLQGTVVCKAARLILSDFFHPAA